MLDDPFPVQFIYSLYFIQNSMKITCNQVVYHYQSKSYFFKMIPGPFGKIQDNIQISL